MNEENRLPQGVVTAPRVRHPKQLLSEAWLRSLSFFRSSRRKIVQSPTKQLEKGPVMMASCSVPSQPMVSQQSSSFAIQHKTQQHLPKPTIDVRLDCPIIMGYLLKYSELEHNCENIRFVMDVDRLRDLMVLHMRPVWEEKHWRELDANVRVLEVKGVNNESQYKRTLEMVSLLLLQESALATKNAILTEMLNQRGHTSWSPEKNEAWAPQILRYATGLPLPSSNGTPTDGGNDDSVKPEPGLWNAPLEITKPTATKTNKRDEFSRWLSGKDMIDREINRIWRTYLDVQAPCQVTTADIVLERTKIRAKYFTLYGPDMFAEAMLEPMFCIQRDIVCRFVKSDEYLRMERLFATCQPLPPPHKLDAPPPTRSLFTLSDVEFLADRRFTCREMVSDRMLYHQFLNYLSRRHSGHALLGVRLLTLFEECMVEKDWEHAEEIAWEIYRYFVAEGSAFEIETDDLDRKETLRCLAKPKMNMFDAIKIIICTQLKCHFEKFRTTATYDGLHRLVIDSLQKKHHEDFVKTKNGCAGIICV